MIRLIRMRAAELGVSQADLAAEANVSIFRMSRVLTGVQPLRAAELEALSRVLELPQLLRAANQEHEHPRAG